MGIDRTSPGTAAVILDDSRNNVLLHLRDDKPMWSLPGGPPDFGESFTDATIREVKEETGLYLFSSHSPEREMSLTKVR